MIELERVMTFHLDVVGPLEAKDGSATNPRRQYWQMSKATLAGPGIRATSALPGIDWYTPYTGNYGRPHVRLPFLTDDGALILLEYRGIVQASDAFVKAVETNSATDWNDQYMRMAMEFDTTSERYAWLTQSLFIARGRLLAAKSIEYELYRLQ